MPSAEGSGSSFGEALRNALGKLGGARPSYTRTGTVSQFKQLFATEHGYQAMREAGLSVKQTRTLENWLDGTSHPNKANSEAINRAYESMRKGSGTPERVRGGQAEIRGRVAYGEDVRDRGDRTAPLRIDMSGASAGGWDRLDDAIKNGTDDDIEEAFGEEVMAEDDNIGGNYPWGFPGGSYTVTVTG